MNLRIPRPTSVELVRRFVRQLGLEAQNHAGEIKLRAERKAGELLGQMEKNRGAATPKRGTTVGPRSRLSDIDITTNQSSRWQAIATLWAANRPRSVPCCQGRMQHRLRKGRSAYRLATAVLAPGACSGTRFPQRR